MRVRPGKHAQSVARPLIRRTPRPAGFMRLQPAEPAAAACPSPMLGSLQALSSSASRRISSSSPGRESEVGCSRWPVACWTGVRRQVLGRAGACALAGHAVLGLPVVGPSHVRARQPRPLLCRLTASTLTATGCTPNRMALYTLQRQQQGGSEAMGCSRPPGELLCCHVRAPAPAAAGCCQDCRAADALTCRSRRHPAATGCHQDGGRPPALESRSEAGRFG